jgi:erythromycin esterase-like protein
MAYVATAIRDIRFPEARTALWAHNAHISKKQLFTGFKDMGAFLYEAAGVSCKSVGLIAFQAEIDWPKVGCGPTVSAKQGSVEWLLWDLGERYLLVDLDFPGASEPLFEPGVTYDINWGNFQIPADNYDALVYMNFAARMIPVNRPPC